MVNPLEILALGHVWVLVNGTQENLGRVNVKQGEDFLNLTNQYPFLNDFLIYGIDENMTLLGKIAYDGLNHCTLEKPWGVYVFNKASETGDVFWELMSTETHKDIAFNELMYYLNK